MFPTNCAISVGSSCFQNLEKHMLWDQRNTLRNTYDKYILEDFFEREEDKCWEQINCVTRTHIH